MDTDHIKQMKLRDLTLELGRGETYHTGKPTLYGHGTYGRNSVLRGQPRRVFIESWESVEEAKTELKASKLRYTDLTGTGGTTHVSVSGMVAHLPDDSDY